jgi:hypothetical protein
LRRLRLDHGHPFPGLPAIFGVLLDYDIAPVKLNASIRHMAGAPEAIQDDITGPRGGRYNVPAHLDGLFARMLALIIANGREIPHVRIRHFRRHLERPPEVFIVCSEVFINVWFWDGFESGPGRFVKLLIRRNWPPRLVRIEKLL